MLLRSRPYPGLSATKRLRSRKGDFLRLFSSNGISLSYADTVPNLKIGKDTRVIFQGFTGRQATQNAQQSLEWRTKIVGGVTPGRDGEHLGLPVLPNVRKAKEQLKPDATGIFVAAQFAAKAIEEAIEAEVPLIAAVAEHIPLHDILRISSILATQSKSRLVGANSPGIISAIGHCRIGFQPLPTFSPGHVGIAAKSGTLSYEAVASLSRAGVGQSLCIGIGGDTISGTSMTDALKVFETDDDTHGIVLIGEIGGEAEVEAANWIAEYHQRTTQPKPISALIAGFQAPPARVMGHAGAWIAPGEPSAEEKHKKLEQVGVTMVDHPAKFGTTMRNLLSSKAAPRQNTKRESSVNQQKRTMHTSRSGAAGPTAMSSSNSNCVTGRVQCRSLTVSSDAARKMLSDKGYKLSNSISLAESVYASPSSNWQETRSFPIDLNKGPSRQTLNALLQHTGFDHAPSAFQSEFNTFVNDLFYIFRSSEAVSLELTVSQSQSNDPEHSGLHVQPKRFVFDDAAVNSAQRQTHLLDVRDLAIPEYQRVEREAAKHGIVYVKLTPEDASANIGTLVNGAGLAMNTVDALSRRGGRPANFLDTGGKATAETVKKSFEAVLADERVKVIFVNIFGGLTLCNMIADGVMLAFRELGEKMRVPVVVRLRGTNEELGQKMIAESGLDLSAYDDFEEAAAKVIELANAKS
ncbi:MAG: hypothetical protein M1822_007846 [Bathelium mastoideum]|nr:MAG: hypothetical protein M1822_007846 [Bathelium mastoideum]